MTHIQQIISDMNSDLEGTVADQETRLTAAEENIQGRSTFRHGPSYMKLSFNNQGEIIF